jgi:hypothetical protein
MGKRHSDNHQARLKRGPAAFAKKAARRAAPKRDKCNLCGTASRKLESGICSKCLSRSTGH